MKDVIIIGGGLSGLIGSILLKKAGLSVLLLEKHQYPFHRVCGEYISNEVVPFLSSHGLYPSDCKPAAIDTLQITSPSGRLFSQKLDLGGFGISRYTFDHWLANKAKEAGVEIRENCTATAVQRKDAFRVETKNETYEGRLVIGSHGKRSLLDKTLQRNYLNNRSPFVGVKYHLHADLPPHLISLHNFKGGYCGISEVENETFNLCYLAHRRSIRESGSIETFEKNILTKNPHLKQVFDRSQFLFKRPLVINEVQFSAKEPVSDHIFFTGDAAGTIVPLTGNGMAMAIRSAKLLSGSILKHWNGQPDLLGIQNDYRNNWHRHFAKRLWAGRQLQHLFGSSYTSGIAVTIGKSLKPVSRALIKMTHGQPFT